MTKLRPSRAGANVIARPRLVELLPLGRSGRLTVRAAPAGYGKTTLLGQWCEHATDYGAVVAWLALEGSENDQAMFWRYVLGALRTGGCLVGESLEARLRVPGADVARIVAALVNELARESAPIVLVLDDYQVIREHDSHRLMSWFVEHTPPNVHVVVASRRDPPLALGSCRVGGGLAEARARDLRFTESEAGALFRAVEGLELSDDELAVLVSRTEGWPAALHLAALWLRRGSDHGELIRQFGGDNRYLVDTLRSRCWPASTRA